MNELKRGSSGMYRKTLPTALLSFTRIYSKDITSKELHQNGDL